MTLFVGLNNPGSNYEGTRHNVGAEVLDRLAAEEQIPLRRGPWRVRSDVGTGRIGVAQVVLAKPRTMMNLSGSAVGALMRYYKVESDDVVIIHDDIDLPFGRLRLQSGRGSGGHNGIKSVVAAIGDASFHRLKVGVGRPPGDMDPAAYVLSRFRREERGEVDRMVDDAVAVLLAFLDDRDQAIQLAGSRRSGA